MASKTALAAAIFGAFVAASPSTAQVRTPVPARGLQPSVRIAQEERLNRTRSVPRIAPLSAQARLARVRDLLADQNISLANTTTVFSLNSPLDLGANLAIRDASTVSLPDGVAIGEGREFQVDYRFPDGFHGRYVFDCYVNSASISWQHAGLQAQAPVSEGHAMFVLDVDPHYWVMITIPVGGWTIWHRCEMTAVQ